MKEKKIFQESELIINPDGSLYHLGLRPEDVAPTVIVVGDQGRVPMVSRYFDKIVHESQNREFRAHTGEYKGNAITVLSTGIGTDNIDIVLNELDAAVNIDLKTRTVKEEHTSLDIIRLGTSGALQQDIPVDSFVASAFGMGFDGLLHFYSYGEDLTEGEMTAAFMQHTSWDARLASPYIVAASQKLLDQLAAELKQGITATANGFFGPQGRELRIPLAHPELNQQIGSFRFAGHRITNFEMETSALYALGKLLGHHTLTICDIIANRTRGEYSRDYQKSVDAMIRYVLDRLIAG